MQFFCRVGTPDGRVLEEVLNAKLAPQSVDAVETAEVSDARQAGVDAHARAQRLAVHQMHAALAKAQRRFAGPHGVIALGFRRVPKGEDGVADVFDHRAIGRMNASRHGRLEITVHVLSEIVRVHALTDGGKVGDVGEDDGDGLLLRAGFHEFLHDVAVAGEFFHQLG
jgi:hypothetical protein